MLICSQCFNSATFATFFLCDKTNIFLSLIKYELNSLLSASHLVYFISVHIQFDLERYLLTITKPVIVMPQFLSSNQMNVWIIKDEISLESHFLGLKGPVKLIKRVKTAYSFLQFVSDQFHIIILSLPICIATNGCQRIFRNPLLEMEK